MITNNAFKEGVALLNTTFRIMPDDDNDRKIALRLWRSTFDERFDTDGDFLSTVKQFILGTPKLYPGDNWLAILLERAKPKVKETVGDVVELILDVLGSVSFLYPDEDTKAKLNWLKSKSPVAYAIGTRLGWSEMARSSNTDVLRGQIRAIADEEIKRINATGAVAMSAKDVVLNGGAIPLKQILQNSALESKKIGWEG